MTNTLKKREQFIQVLISRMSFGGIFGIISVSPLAEWVLPKMLLRLFDTVSYLGIANEHIYIFCEKIAKHYYT